MQQILFRDRELTLNKTTDICKAAENAATQSNAYPAEVVNKVQPTKPNYHKKIEKK